jgi:hypothetical protein
MSDRYYKRLQRSTMRKERLILFLTVLVIIGFTIGLIYGKYLVWEAAHPQAPFWTFLAGSR